MVRSNILAARRFVDFATIGPVPSIGALARCVDELALSYHDTPVGEPNESEAAPPSDIDTTDAVIRARFPDLGFYGTVFGIDVPGEAVIGDAIDDILDIANDLKEVLWRFERFGDDDANWHFRMLFEIHWGQHLRALAYYLHWKLGSETE